eukprot:CAMPEP_0197443478 /NCGR_PEP_ID=MMETSP1175-20131217/9210_1 /TAXON_ID=1003142 /ORGANISM="Triceratium dubium, Strain CCMP147" /LENGTH=487 /DNA_ID=CAMNT_0042974113 /DNA_START=178 /DNA_END=1638 /DNA_ORIENTATION=+
MEEENNSLTEKLIVPTADPEDAVEVSPTGEDEENQAGEDVDETEQALTRGEKQPVQFRDAPFAVLFYLQVIAVVAVAIFVPVKKTADGNEDTGEAIPGQKGVFLFCLVMAGVSFAMAATSLAAMTVHSESLIQTSLLFSIFMSVLMAVLAILQNNVAGAIFGFLLAAVGSCYACAVWRRIPFAAANLKTGLTAVRKNFGITFIAYFLVALSVVYMTVVLIDVVAVFSQTSQCEDGACEEGDTGSFILMLFLFALFWTQQVIKNTIHVTVAGTVGEWWFNPTNASSFCSGAISGSFFRATTYSFGSICFGSLLVAVIQTLRQILHNARRNRDQNSILLCIAECVLACLEDLAKVFNQWAYIYVGLYGYKYVEAGKNVMTLLRQRGWTTIITDDLVSNTLSLICVVLAALTGCAGLILNAAVGSWLEGLGDNSSGFAFMVAFVIGLFISSVMMGVVDSAVNTVIVCFAEAPAEGQANHPVLSEEMVGAW